MKSKKVLFSIFIALFVIIFFTGAIYFTLSHEKNNSYKEQYYGFITKKFIEQNNRDAKIIVVINKHHYCEYHSVSDNIYNNIEVGDSVRKINNDTAFIIIVYRLNTDSKWKKKTYIEKM